MLTKPRLTWGGPGHTGEYVLNLPKYDHVNYIPWSVEHDIAAVVPGFEVSNRGSRLELINRAGYGVPAHDVVEPALRTIYSDLEFQVIEVPPPPSPSPEFLAMLEKIRARRSGDAR
jgi:hypothetical protein